MQHPFAALAGEYENYVAIVRPNPDRMAEIDAVAARLTRANTLAHYAPVEAKIGVPQVVQATICEREDGNDFTKSPAQGDPWDRVSVHVPRGIGPFPDWESSAIYSWTKCDELNVLSVPAWSLSYACWKWEGYNGFGPRAHGRRSSYVVGGTNLQQIGKYVADGVWDPNHMDTQLGCLPVAMRMIEFVPSLAFGHAIEQIVAPSVIPAPAPVPAGVDSAQVVQKALNLLGFGPLIEDGSYGRFTRSAVRSFQAAHGLTQDGLAGPQTLAAIDRAVAAHAS